jgi:hypothetical protein
MPRARQEFTGQVKDPEGPVSFGQATVIGKSIGGLGSYCPHLVGQAGGSHQKALAQMGLTKGHASAVIDAMTKAGVLRPHGGVVTTAAQVATARQILAEVGGVVCSSALGGSSAHENMAGRPGKRGLPRLPLGHPQLSKLTMVQLQAMPVREAFIEIERRKGSRAMRRPTAKRNK